MSLKKDFSNSIKTLGLASLLGISPLSSSAQTSQPNDNSPQPPLEQTFSPSFSNLKETLYTYIPTSKEQYDETIKQGLSALQNDTIPEELKNKYTPFIQFCEENKDKDIDLNDPMIRKTFLAMKKIAKYNALNELGKITPSSSDYLYKNSEQRYDEFSKLLGINAQSFQQTASKSDPKFIAFCSVLYETDDRFNILSKEDAPKAEPIAARLLNEKLSSYNITPQDTIFDYTDFDFKSAVFTTDIDNEYNDWNLQLIIDKHQLNGHSGSYCPLAVVKAHELGHIMQTMPGQKEQSFKENTLCELAPTLELITMQDQIYKEIHNIPLKEEVTYPSKDDSPLPNLGKIANTFRSIKEKYNLKSYEDVLLTKDASIAINKFTKNINAEEIVNNITRDKAINDIITQKIDKYFPSR